MNGAPISVGLESSLGDAVVSGGSPPSAAALAPCMRGLSALAPEVRSLRLLGSAAVMLAWVACGRLSAYFEPDLHAWDSAGVCLEIDKQRLRTDVKVCVTFYVLLQPNHSGCCHHTRGWRQTVELFWGAF